MAYPQFDGTIPDPSTENGTQAFTSTRENLLALRDALIAGMMPGWALTPSGGTAEQPGQVLATKGTEQVKAVFTWGDTGGADGNVTQAVVSYSSNSGVDWETIGTATLTYDSSGNWTGTTWS